MADKNKLVFLEINSSFSHSMPGYCLIRAYAEQEAPDWEWGHVEATLKTPKQEIIDNVINCKPKLLLATGYIFNLELLLEICAELKKIDKNLRIYLGGPSFLGNNKDFLQNNYFVDGVIRGDESSIPDLLKKTDFVAGLCYLDNNGTYHDNGIAEYAAELDTLPSPYQSGLIHQGKAFYQLETSRGCGGACSFCTSSKSRGVKYFSLERVAADLLALHEQGYRDIRLIDRTFNEDTKRAIAMLKMFRNDFSDMRFHLEIHPGRLKIEVLAELAKAPVGSLHLEAGIQSFDPVVLKEIRRPALPEKAVKGLKALLDCGNFEVHADLIAGLPKQTLESLLSDINRMLKIAPDEIQLENLKLLPGTYLRDNLPEKMIFNTRIPWQVLQTREMDKSELEIAVLYSYVLDSWYNPPALINVFRFCAKYMKDFFPAFVSYVKPFCDLSKGKMPLEKRFEILEDYLRERNTLAYELCCFAKLASGFRCKEIETQKLNDDFQIKKNLWSKPGISKDIKIKRCCVIGCSFNTGDFWIDHRACIDNRPHKYIFKLHYGRNVAFISEI